MSPRNVTRIRAMLVPIYSGLAWLAVRPSDLLGYTLFALLAGLLYVAGWQYDRWHQAELRRRDDRARAEREERDRLAAEALRAIGEEPVTHHEDVETR